MVRVEKDKRNFLGCKLSSLLLVMGLITLTIARCYGSDTQEFIKQDRLFSGKEQSRELDHKLNPLDHLSMNTDEKRNVTSVTGEIKILSDGTMRGTIQTRTKGSEAELMRKLLTEMSMQGAEEVAAQLLRRQNLEGHAHLQEIKGSNPQELTLEASFTIANRIEKDGSLRIPLNSGMRVSQLPQSRYIKLLRENIMTDDICNSNHYEQRIIFHMPNGFVIKNDEFKVSDYVAVKLPNATFIADYSLHDNSLLIFRQLSIDISEELCSKDLIVDFVPAIRAAGREFNRVLTLSTINQ